MTNILPSTEPISNSDNPVQNVTPPIDVAPAPVTPAGTPKKRNYLPWLLGILVLIIIFTTSFLIMTGKSKSTPTSSLTQPSVSPEQATVADTSIDMSSWKTYTNKQVGFTLKYPSTWRENDISSIDFGTPVLAAIDLDSDPQNPLPYESFGDSIRLIVYQNPNNLTTDEFVKKEAFKNETRDKNFDYGNYKKGTQYDFYGLKGTKIENVEAPPGERGPSIFIPKDNFILSISTMNTSATNQKILNEALYTFEFTDASLVSFVKNKLKSSDESGISIKIVDGDYARGTAGTAGGCNWFAAKKDGIWHSFLCINGTPSCSDAEPFPSRILHVCYDGTTEVDRTNK